MGVHKAAVSVHNKRRAQGHSKRVAHARRNNRENHGPNRRKAKASSRVIVVVAVVVDAVVEVIARKAVVSRAEVPQLLRRPDAIVFHDRLGGRVRHGLCG